MKYYSVFKMFPVELTYWSKKMYTVFQMRKKSGFISIKSNFL